MKIQQHRLALTMLLLVVGAIGTPRYASAAYKDVIALSCTNAVHVADFKNCVALWNLHNGKTGLFVATNPTSAATALIKSTGTYTFTCSPCLFGGGTLTPINQDGTPLTTDAQLLALDQTLFAQMRKAGAIAKPINIPPNYGVSYINNDALAEDTNSAISLVLYTQLGVNPNDVPRGTVVTVIWQDGTSAQFVRISLTGSIQWQYKPGTAKDKNGNPIDPNGTKSTNPNAGQGSGSGDVGPIVTPSNGYNWNLNLRGGNSCTATTIVTFPDGTVFTGIAFFQCP